jgi:predicted ATPase
MAAACDIVDGALQASDVLSLCQVLVHVGCPVSLFVGDREKLGRFVELLLDYSARNALDFWHVWGRCFKGVLLIRQGQTHAGLTLLRAALVELRDIRYGVYYAVFLGEFAEASGRVDSAAQGLAAIDEALARSERNEERWYIPELLRIKGALALRAGGPRAVSEAETFLQQSLDLARRQHTPSWELRTALDLCRLWRDAGRASQARSLLAPLYSRFTEGFDTEDLRAARELLSELP